VNEAEGVFASSIADIGALELPSTPSGNSQEPARGFHRRNTENKVVQINAKTAEQLDITLEK
jgi:hypothetical protein